MFKLNDVEIRYIMTDCDRDNSKLAKKQNYSKMVFLAVKFS